MTALDAPVGDYYIQQLFFNPPYSYFDKRTTQD